MDSVTAAERSASADGGLVQRAARGDVAAFDAILAGRVDRCYRIAWSILANDADAADATQDAFVTLGDDEVKVSLERVPVLRVRQPRPGDQENVGDPDLGRDPEPDLLGGTAEFAIAQDLMSINEERADHCHCSGPCAIWGMPSTLIRSTSDRAIFR